eukprot:TRINITY_DN15429_c0_g2_i6.p1 TRINITY_DN15429_c0_g2~~TRINITY_DN15429_c0_g2_i6.p1  ORF type:complete len:347 (-),score=26.95 TRINITY_DN15429_c0_g2_i6:496-1452(-)
MVFIAVLIVCLSFHTYCQEQEATCCHVNDAELEKFQYIRDKSHKFFIIIGVQKSGTTLTYDILAQHPQTVKILKKKIGTATNHFFLEDSKFEEYLTWFNLTALEAGYAMIEATPVYILSSGAACRIKAYLPNAKILVVVKNPAERALSNFKMGYFKQLCECKHLRGCKPCKKVLSVQLDFYSPTKREIVNFKQRNCDLVNKSWTDCFGCYPEQAGMLKRGFYAAQLQMWLEYFSPNEILVINHKDTYRLNETANKIYEFVNLQPFTLKQAQGFKGIKYARSKNIKRGLDLLEEFYKPYNKMFYEMMERDFNVQNFSFH